MSNITECSEFFPYGSQWVRADFHLHTDADREFSTNGAERYHQTYIEKLRSAGIRVGLITNHNKFDFGEFKTLRRKAKREGIFLMPGVELSVNDGSNGIHTLIVFNDEWIANGQDFINQFLNVAFAGKTPDQYENENARCSLGLIDTIRKLDEYNKDYFLAFAHVEDKRGLWNELDGGRLEELGRNELFQRRALAFQKVRTHDKADRKCRIKVQGWLGDSYPAEVEGSDPKELDKIGKGKPCYLKIGDFTFEAVKYALIDHTNRLRNAPQESRHSHIVSVVFDGGVLDGKTIKFSPGLNSLIGIRGSGKSSILEAIRYALNIPFGEKALDEEYKNRLVDHVLGSGGKVTVRAVDQRGQHYEVRRINRESPDVYIDDVLRPGISIRETILHKPMYFGQKDLSATGDGFEKDLVEKLVGEKLSEIRLKIDEQRQKVIEAVGQYRKLDDVEEKKAECQASKKNAEHLLGFYKEHGVEEKLQKQIDFDVDSRKCSQMISFTVEYLGDLENLIGQYEDDLRNHLTYKSKQNKKFFDAFLAIYNKVVTSFDTLQRILVDGKSALEDLKIKSKEFEKLKSGLKEKFAGIERKLSEQLRETGTQAINTDEFRKLRQALDNATQMLKVLEKQESSRADLHESLLKELSILNELWLEEYKLIQTELAKVNESHASLEILSEFKGDKVAFLMFMKEMFRGSRLRETTFSTLVDEFADFGGIYKELHKAKGLIGSSSATFKEYLFKNLGDFLVWQVPNKFTIEYRGKELKHHSLGQRASALILFVLSQRENDLFIIDQPEDDLDNQTIYEDVIKLILKLKAETQFIFATHNANFPVLGDGEQIISCAYSDESIQVKSGSIDCPALQQEIVDIMEGGEDAFKLRRKKYEIWKPQI